MFIINPDPYLLPTYRISPFTTSDIALNNSLPEDNSVKEYFIDRFGGKEFFFTYNGRQALHYALAHFKLKREDKVTVLTTTGNFYISRCVTDEIQKFCNWTRQIEPETKVILVNHEFGYPYEDLKNLKETGIPIIEDCAHSFFSIDKDKAIGTIGEFVIFSFPKIFPLQIGGLLLSNIQNNELDIISMDAESQSYLNRVLSFFLKRKNSIIEQRLINYNILKDKFQFLGFGERFNLDDGVVPGVFMFSAGLHNIDLPKLKEFYYAHGVQCSIFYGEDSFFLPVHQALNKTDLEYFTEIIRSFLKHDNL
jgi:hypothetical protein